MLFLQTLAFVVLGIFFLVRGLRGRYLGPEPRCRSCTYQLTGRLDAECCPECGTILTPKTLVYGLRKPRWWSMIAVVVVVAMFWAFPGRVLWKLRQVYWYQYYPVGMLLWRAKVDQPHAILELARRASYGALSSESSHEIAGLALQKLDQWPLTASDRAWSRLLEAMDRGRLLSDEQRDRLFPRFAQASLTVRALVRQGDPIVVRLDYQSSRAGLHGYRFWHEPARVSVEGYEIFRTSGDAWRDREPDWHREDRSPVCSKAMTFPTVNLRAATARVEYTGRHVFLYPEDVRYRRWDVSLDPNVDGCTEIPSWSKEITLSSGVEILPANASDPVVWLVAPDVKQQLDDTIGIYVIDKRRRSSWWIGEWSRDEAVSLERDGDREVLNMSVSFSEPSPIPVAFDLVLEADGVELATDFVVHTTIDSWRRACPRPMLVWRAEESGAVRGIARVPQFTADEVSLILRGSRDVARKTVDMYEVWQGELRFGPFRVEHTSP